MVIQIININLGAGAQKHPAALAPRAVRASKKKKETTKKRKDDAKTKEGIVSFFS